MQYSGWSVEWIASRKADKIVPRSCLVLFGVDIYIAQHVCPNEFVSRFVFVREEPSDSIGSVLVYLPGRATLG